LKKKEKRAGVRVGALEKRNGETQKATEKGGYWKEKKPKGKDGGRSLVRRKNKRPFGSQRHQEKEGGIRACLRA